MIANLLARATKLAGAAKGFLAAKVVPILGTALVLVATSFAWQTWRIDRLKTELAETNSFWGVCKAENKLNELAFEEINAAAERRLAQANAAREAAELTAAKVKARRNADIQQLEGRLQAIRDAYSAETDACVVPDDVDRMLRAGTPYSRQDGDEDGDPVRPDPG